MWILKGIFKFIAIIIFLALVFLSTYTVLSTIIPALQSGGSFWGILKEMTDYMYAVIRSLIG